MLAPTVFSVIIFFTVIALCYAAYHFWQRNQDLKDQSNRVESAVNIQPSGYSEAGKEESIQKSDQEQTLRRDMRISSIPWLNELMSNRLKEKSKSLMILIDQSGLRIKVGELVLFSVLIGFIGAMTIDFFFQIPVAGFIFSLLPFWVLGFLKAKRTETFVKQMPQALDLLSSDLRAGLDVIAGLKHLSEEFPQPVGEEFAKLIVEVNLGLPLHEALNNLSNRMNTMDVQILCTGIIINRELGGNLSELIVGIGETIRERFRLKGIVKALTAENQMSTILLMALPVVLYIMLNCLAPSTYNSFAADPIGRMILVGCGISMAVGYLIIKKITKLEV